MKQKQLTLGERKIIQDGLEKSLSRVEIANLIGKDPTTVGKEIKKRRILRPRNIFNRDSICIHLKECKKCYSKCDRYEEPKCLRRDRIVGVCNLCPNSKACILDKYFYYASKAHEDYLYTLSDSRQGVNLNTTQVSQIASIIKPLLKKGQIYIPNIKKSPRN